MTFVCVRYEITLFHIRLISNLSLLHKKKRLRDQKFPEGARLCSVVGDLCNPQYLDAAGSTNGAIVAPFFVQSPTIQCSR
jgi:hypothetical protein